MTAKRTRASSGQKPSEGEALLALQLRQACIPFAREFYGALPRLYRWDFLIPPDVVVEVQGGVWDFGKSGHSSPQGITRDAAKASLAVACGWRQITATTAQVKSGEAVEWIKRAIGRAA